MHFGRDVKAFNIPQHRDVKLNELPKQIFMLLPLLLHWLYYPNIPASRLGLRFRIYVRSGFFWGRGRWWGGKQMRVWEGSH